MSKISGVFTQTPQEKRRYILNYQLTLSAGEVVASIAAPTITQIFGKTAVVALVVDSIVIGPDGTEATFYCSGGDDGTQFEVQFLATTSVAQILEDVVKFNIDGDL